MEERTFVTPITGKPVKIVGNTDKDTYIMAIESSCDETSCAIVKNGREVISNIISSQIKTHMKYGGVVPEVAAREHLENINFVIDECFKNTDIKPEEIDAFAATVGPGLVGCLLVGLNAAKAMSLVYDKPFIGVNHLNAHVCANYIDTNLEPPFIALLVSGGHTQIILVKDYGVQEILGETTDDSVGEAYDKVARLIGLPYPGGALLDKLAQEGDKKAYLLPSAKVDKYSFSFSGLKTATLNLLKKVEKEENFDKKDLAASFQECVTKTLLKKTLTAAKDYGLSKIVLCGGVAANSEVRKKFSNLRETEGFEIFIPPLKYCTDNAAMVGSAAYFLTNTFTDLSVEVFSRSR